MTGLVEWFHVNLGHRCEHGRMQGRFEVRPPCENWAEQLMRHLRAVAADEGVRVLSEHRWDMSGPTTCTCGWDSGGGYDWLDRLNEHVIAQLLDHLDHGRAGDAG